MATSLARQLALLRTPGSVKSSLAASTSVYSGPFIVPEAETEHSSLASLKGCVAESLSALCQLEPQLMRFSVLLEMEEEEAEARALVRECLTLICPHILNKHCQWLLQWLVIRHKVSHCSLLHFNHHACSVQVHINCPGWLVFTLLPYYSYKIYAAVLQTVDPSIRREGGEAAWLGGFQQTCVPTSQPGLHRHLASSPAFFRFLCDSALQLARDAVTFPELKLHKQTTFLLSTLLGGLENIKSVSDEQVVLILQVILSGLKSSNADLSSLSCILMGYLLPKVTLKQKVIQKLCKSLLKFSTISLNEDTLHLVLLMARTQKPDMNKIFELINKHQPSINNLVAKAGSSDRDKDFLEQTDSLVYSLTSILESMVPTSGEMKIACTKLESDYVDAFTTVSKLSKLVVEDTADFAIDVVLELIKHLEVSDANKSVKKKLSKIAEAFGDPWPEVYNKNLNKHKTDDGDIFFIPSVENPSDIQLVTARIISSNQLIQGLSNSILVQIIPGKGAKKILKNNMNDLLTLLNCSTEFLISQFGAEKLEVLLVNLLHVSCSQKTGVLTENVVKHLCTGALVSKLTNQPLVELLLVSALATSSAASRAAILGSELGRSSALLSLLASLDPASDAFVSALVEKLVVILDPQKINVLLNNKCLLYNGTLVTVILALGPKLLEKSFETWSEAFTSLIASVLVNLQTNKIEGNDGDIHEVVDNTRKSNSIPWKYVKDTISSLLSPHLSADQCRTIFCCLPVLLERGVPEDCLDIATSILEHLDTTAISFLLTLGSQNQDVKIACFSLFLAEKYCRENSDKVQDIFKKKSDKTVLFLLSALMSEHSKVQKAAFKVLETLDLSSATGVKLVLQFFANHKEELIHHSGNIEKVLDQDSIDAKACRELLSRACTVEDAEVFVKISPLFWRLTSSKDADSLFHFGVECLKEAEDVRMCEVVAEIITNFVPLHSNNFNSDVVWDFFNGCILSKIQTKARGLSRSLAQHLLATLTGLENLKTNLGLQAKFLSSLSKNSQSEFFVEARLFLAYVAPGPQLMMEEFQNIWGQEAFSGKRTSGRGKFSLLYGVSEDNSEDIQRWSQTCWLLEVVEKVAGQQEGAGGGEWLPLLRPLFVLLRKVSQMEVEETAYKMTLLLNVLKVLLTTASNEDLKNVDQSQIDPELLVFCIRTNPNPDTRHTALQVLARCVIFNPDFILQNSITIFTFMGSHLLRVDSRHSFQVACQALDVIVPAIRTACQAAPAARSGAKLQTASLGVLTTFIDACLDIPAHRLTEFLVRLIRCLGEREYLWFAALLIVRKDKTSGERKVVELLCQMGALNGVEALVRLLVNTRGDTPQLRKMFGVKAERKEDAAAKEKPDDWDLVRFRALQVVTSVLTAASFRGVVGAALGEEEAEQLVSLLLEAAILTLNTYASLNVVMPAKFKRNLLTQSEKVLEHSLSLLPASTFVGQCTALLASEDASVRHRALEVVSAKLSAAQLAPAELPALVPPLTQLALTETQPHTQQLALLGVRQLAKLLPEPIALKEAAEAFSCAYLAGLRNAKVLGAAVLSCGDIFTSLGPHVVARVPGLVTWLADTLDTATFGQEQGWTDKEVAVVFNSFMYCIQKLIEAFIGFLSPLLPRLILLTCSLAGRAAGATVTLGRARALLSCLAATVPPHAALGAASQLLGAATAATLPHLATFLADNCRRLERGQLSSVSKQLVEFYTRALAFRADKEADVDKVDEVEDSVIEAFLSIALKLSLEDFGPVYQKLSSTLIIGDDNQLITLFNLTNKVGGKLKSLFSFGVDSLVDFVTTTFKEEKPDSVVSACLQSLTTVLRFNKLDTVSVEQYEGLVAALLAPWVLAQPDLVPCLVQLAVSTPEDTNWKHLHFQTLLQLRDERPGVRMAVLAVLRECVTDRADTYLPVLPDAVPFLQEILEDDNSEVEAACQDFIQHMESVFGQNLESYFV